jgi:hypothetical protein
LQRGIEAGRAMPPILSTVLQILQASKLKPPAVDDQHEKARHGFPSERKSSVSIS